MTNDDIPPLLDSPHAPVFSLTRLVSAQQDRPLASPARPFASGI